MIRQCALTSTLLLVVSVATRLAVDQSVGGVRGSRFLERAAHWRDVARSEREPLLSVQHLSAALTWLSAAREVSSDADLERYSGLDVLQLQRALERDLRRARQNALAPPGQGGA